MKDKSKITQRDFDFIVKNRGKLSQSKMADRFGVHRTYIARVQLLYLRNGVRTIQQFKDEVNGKNNAEYAAKRQEQKERSWEAQVDEGMEIYHFVMRRHKLPRKVIYQLLRSDFDDIQRMRKAA